MIDYDIFGDYLGCFLSIQTLPNYLRLIKTFTIKSSLIQLCHWECQLRILLLEPYDGLSKLMYPSLKEIEQRWLKRATYLVNILEPSHRC